MENENEETGPGLVVKQTRNFEVVPTCPFVGLGV